MELNFGILKENINTLLLTENFDNTNSYKGYVDLLKSSTILKNEFFIYNTLENTNFNNKEIAIVYLNKLLDPFKSYSYNEVCEENKKLANVMGDVKPISDESKKLFFEAINNLILASTQDGIYKIKDFEKSMEVVLTKITQPEVLESEINDDEIDMGYIKSDELYETSLKIYEDTFFESLNDKQKEIISEIFSKDENDYNLIFEEVKKHVIDSLTDDIENDEETINECIVKISRTKYNPTNFYNDITDFLGLIGDDNE
jgi:hypothetical protein